MLLMQDLVQWLESPDATDDDQSTIDSAWQSDPFEHRDFETAAKLVEGALHRNLSLVTQQQGQFEAAVWHANASLEAEPGNLKSRYRRAAALMHLNRRGEAEADLRAILTQEPRNGDAQRLLRCARSPAPGQEETESDAPKACGCSVCQLWKDQLLGSTAAELLKSGAKGLLTRRDAQGRTALHLAVLEQEGSTGSSPRGRNRASRCPGLVEALLDAGAEVELADVDERTPLHLAAVEGRTQATSLLLDAGSSPDTLDRYSPGTMPCYQLEDLSDLSTS
ncbi:FEM1A [Symbiodinium natans]|uniref:FEM1A protein n=1 Tax=Symbiodinium natans TaxID=878477 RepID=A0A812PU40_9DINO|nr:FEM1A [Symbiodinium natans]